jgi:hypothetical protein
VKIFILLQLNDLLIISQTISNRDREELDNLLHRKIEDPTLDVSAEGKIIVQAAVGLLHSSNVHN